jgi:hypothetical protein
VQLIDQAVDTVCGITLSDLGEAGITCGGGGTGMAEQTLDMAQAQAVFE